jgi:hypothetical protein
LNSNRLDSKFVEPQMTMISFGDFFKQQGPFTTTIGMLGCLHVTVQQQMKLEMNLGQGDIKSPIRKYLRC